MCRNIGTWWVVAVAMGKMTVQFCCVIDCPCRYLAGSFDVKTRRIAIRAAYPGRSISNDSNAFQEAEMDPVYEVELRARIEKDGHKIVGWCVRSDVVPACDVPNGIFLRARSWKVAILPRYHSHPTFKPVPSAVDVNNQRNYQRLFQHNVRQSSPFVGLIVSPYVWSWFDFTSRHNVHWCSLW